MSAREEKPSSEFSSFLEDVAEEVSARVREMMPQRPMAEIPSKLDDERRILDWPELTDRMIDELR